MYTLFFLFFELTNSLKYSNIFKKVVNLLTIIQKIHSEYDQLSNKRKLIADYLLDNQSDIPFMSLEDLSKNLQVSEVTILNFCKAMDLLSYVELKKAFELLIKESLRVPAKMKSSLEEIISVEEAYNNAVQTQKFNFEQLKSDNPLSAFEDASHYIAQARHVYICGLGVSKIVCQFLQERLRTLDIDAIQLNIEDISLFSHDLHKASKKDIFILIAFPDYSEQTLQLRTYLADKGLDFVAITNDNTSPLIESASVCLYSKNKSLVFYNFISATISVVEILLIILSYLLKGRLIPKIQEVKEIQEYFSSDK